MTIHREGDDFHLKAALRQYGGFHLATEWYFGWKPLPYQYAYHQALQPNTTFLAGIAAGKTAVSSASITMDCLTIPFFKALSTSVTAKQAELGFDMFMGWYESSPRLQRLVYDVKMRPWPVIIFKNFSEWEHRTAGFNARFIRGTEYDRIVYDEAGLDFQGETVKILRGRLRGRRADRSLRMCRLDIITSPTDSPWLRERFDRGIPGNETSDLRRYLSMKIRTRDNIMLTEEMISLMETEYTEEMIEVEMNANFPDYGMSFFPKRHIDACTDQSLNDLAYISLNPEDGSKPKPGYVVDEHPRYGVTHFELPYDPRGRYVMAGDPGMGDPPHRNAGSIGVLRIDTTPHTLVFFDWVSGKGSYGPFLSMYKYAINKYHPSVRLLDTTATQKGIQELGFDKLGIRTDSFNFSSDKDHALNALSLMVSDHELVWPVIKGIIKQMAIYTKQDDDKLDQDNVMMLAMLAFASRMASYTTQNIQTSSRVHKPNRKARNPGRVKHA